MKGAPRRALDALSAVVIGVIGPAAGSKPPWLHHPKVLVAVGLAPLVALAVAPRRAWWARLIVAAGAAVLVVGTFGKVPAVWAGSSLLLAGWVAFDRPPLPRLSDCFAGTSEFVALIAVAAVVAGRGATATWQPLAVLCGAWLLALLASWSTNGWRGIVGLLAAAASALAWVLALVARPLRHLVWTRADAGVAGGWADSPKVPVRPSSRQTRAVGVGRLRRWVVPTMAVVILATGLAVVSRVVDVPWGSRPGRAPLAGSTHGVPLDGGDRAYREDIAWITDEAVAMRPFRPDRIADVATRTVNVRNGERATWKAGACGCRRVSVWLYGGSGAFGLGQDDQHTVASDLARIAARHGYALDVSNRAQPGELHWRDATLFSWDLTEQDPPDMVLFYGGGEEVEAALALHRRGLGDVLAPYDPGLVDRYDELVGPVTAPGTKLDQGELVGWPRHRGPEPVPGVLAVRRYQRSRAMAAGTAAAVGVPARWFWEPDRYAAESSTSTSGDERERAAAYRAASRALPGAVVDLSGALAGATRHQALFDGATALSEDGAALVAEAIWSHLEGDVDRLSRGKAVAP